MCLICEYNSETHMRTPLCYVSLTRIPLLCVSETYVSLTPMYMSLTPDVCICILTPYVCCHISLHTVQSFCNPYACVYVFTLSLCHTLCVSRHVSHYVRRAPYVSCCRARATPKRARAAACRGEEEGWGRVPFSKKLMSPTPRRKWYLTTGRRAH